VADLHMHTTASDGTLAPAALVARVAAAGVEAFAITDHDTVAALPEARRAAAAHGLTLVTGVELSVTAGEREMHLLAYGFDPDHVGLRAHLDAFLDARVARAEAMTEKLAALGLTVPMEDVRQAAGGGAIGRPHVAAALVRRGYVHTPQAAFDRYIGRGQPAFVAKPDVPARRALDLVHAAGGLGVLAHPGHATGGWMLKQLVDDGLDGLEVFHPAHDAMLRDYYARMAHAFDLVMTGGSDFHARPPEAERDRLGRIGLTAAHWERLRPLVT
jgi:predicted metal-dependent phosphoesterase TrpH